jgi:putative SOS response-associated peptidase YedK
MCGRVIRTSPVEALREIFDLVAVPDGLRDRYNLAPSEPIPVIRRPHHLELLRWGLKMRASAHRDRTKRPIPIGQNGASRSPISAHADRTKR